MSTNQLLLLQALLSSFQIINAGLAEVLPSTPLAHFVALSVAALVGGLQFYVQHIGNQTLPTEVKK